MQLVIQALWHILCEKLGPVDEGVGLFTFFLISNIMCDVIGYVQ